MFCPDVASELIPLSASISLEYLSRKLPSFAFMAIGIVTHPFYHNSWDCFPQSSSFHLEGNCIFLFSNAVSMLGRRYDLIPGKLPHQNVPSNCMKRNLRCLLSGSEHMESIGLHHIRARHTVSSRHSRRRYPQDSGTWHRLYRPVRVDVYDGKSSQKVYLHRLQDISRI